MPNHIPQSDGELIEALAQLGSDINAPLDFKGQVLARIAQEPLAPLGPAAEPHHAPRMSFRSRVFDCALAAGLACVFFFCLGLTAGAAGRNPLLRWLYPHDSYGETLEVGAEHVNRRDFDAAKHAYERFLPYAAEMQGVVIRKEIAAICYAQDAYDELIAIVTPSLLIAPDLTLLRYRLAACDVLGACESTLTQDLEAAAHLGDEDAQRRLAARQRPAQRQQLWPLVGSFDMIDFT